MDVATDVATDGVTDVTDVTDVATDGVTDVTDEGLGEFTGKPSVTSGIKSVAS